MNYQALLDYCTHNTYTITLIQLLEIQLLQEALKLSKRFFFIIPENGTTSITHVPTYI